MSSEHTTTGLMTIQAYAALPADDGLRHELSRGRLVSEPQPGLPHGTAVVLIARHIAGYALDHGGVVTSETGFVLREDPVTLRGPDVAYMSADPEPFGAPGGFIRGAPDLAVEVASPSNSAVEIHEKVLEYFEAGARQVWVVHPRTRTVVLHTSASEARTLGPDDEIHGGDVLPGFRLPVAEIFRF